MMTTKPLFILLIFVSLAALLSGCFMDPARKARIAAQNDAIHRANEHMATIKNVGLVYPDVHLYQISTEERNEVDAWTEQATPNLIAALKRELQGQGISLTVIEPKGGLTPEMKDNYVQYRQVTARLGWNATYRKELCAEMRNCRQHSLGKIARIIDDADVDALLFVDAENDIETTEAKEARQLYNVKRTLMGALGTIYISVDRHPGLYMSMGLVNKNGEVFWYSSRWIGKEADLRDPATAEELTKRILMRLKGSEK